MLTVKISALASTMHRCVCVCVYHHLYCCSGDDDYTTAGSDTRFGSVGNSIKLSAVVATTQSQMSAGLGAATGAPSED